MISFGTYEKVENDMISMSLRFDDRLTDPIEETFLPVTYEETLRICVNRAWYWLVWQHAEFFKLVQQIKPHYLDRTAVPYLHMAVGWRAAYHKFIAYNGDLSKFFGQYTATLQLFKENLMFYSILIPSLEELHQKKMEQYQKNIVAVLKQFERASDKLKAFQSGKLEN